MTTDQRRDAPGMYKMFLQTLFNQQEVRHVVVLWLLWKRRSTRDWVGPRQRCVLIGAPAQCDHGQGAVLDAVGRVEEE